MQPQQSQSPLDAIGGWIHSLVIPQLANPLPGPAKVDNLASPIGAVPSSVHTSTANPTPEPTLPPIKIVHGALTPPPSSGLGTAQSVSGNDQARVMAEELAKRHNPAQQLAEGLAQRHAPANTSLPDNAITQLIQKYFPPDQWSNAYNVMKVESGGNPSNHNFNPDTGDDSWGLFQINRYGSLANSRPDPQWLVDPENNIKYAAQMWSRSGWTGPWATTSRKLGLSQ